MPTALRESSLAAIAAPGTNTTATVERARRAAVDTKKDTLPHINLLGGDLSDDITAEPQHTHTTLSFTVVGHVRACTDLAADRRCRNCTPRRLRPWRPGSQRSTAWIRRSTRGAELRLLDAEESEHPAGRFEARFNVLIVAPTGIPSPPRAAHVHHLVQHAQRCAGGEAESTAGTDRYIAGSPSSGD